MGAEQNKAQKLENRLYSLEVEQQLFKRKPRLCSILHIAYRISLFDLPLAIRDLQVRVVRLA